MPGSPIGGRGAQGTVAEMHLRQRIRDWYVVWRADAGTRGVLIPALGERWRAKHG